MYNQTAVKSITTSTTTTEDNTMITLGQMIEQRNNINMYMMGLELGGACYTTCERQLSRLDHAIEIEIGQLQEREAEKAHVTVRVVIKNNYMETMAGDTIQVRVSIPVDDFGADNIQLELRDILDSNLIWDAFSLSGMWICSVDS